tara:strand:- start:773 stop:976 length:204 start_codon:yes stop_codon:yes gene_type:complete
MKDLNLDDGEMKFIIESLGDKCFIHLEPVDGSLDGHMFDLLNVTQAKMIRDRLDFFILGKSFDEVVK